MAGLFIDVEVDPEAARNGKIAKQLEEVCPVNIFQAGPEGVTILEENLDECVFCDLCLEVAPGKVQIKKLYDT